MIKAKFKKIHPEAQLPARNHESREFTPQERATIIRHEVEQLKSRGADELQARMHVESFLDSMGNKMPGTGDTGYDIYAVEDKTIPAKGSAVVDTGVEVSYIMPGYWFAIMPRSGMGFKHGIQPHIGTVDNGYRGNCGVKLYNFSDNNYEVKKGDKIAQLIFYPVVEVDVEWSEEKAESDRGEKGFGSSGS